MPEKLQNWKASKDDVLDAMVLSLGEEFNLTKLPETPEKDAKGKPMLIIRPID
jgi:predicted RNase H-like nuclease